ncbi:MAG TPA: tetratricopeptide repeat protein [Gemmatimonadales bacterium]|jgi:DNA-binding transcriptional MerR regulator|nr:tetratricopeptide repeat protein [Gemmatimonadales bacterium]
MKSYTTTDVARLLGLSAGQVRSLARSGVLSPDRGPRGALRFSFQDLVLLRTAKALVAARLTPRRIRRALRRLVEQLPRGRSMSEVRITAEGDRVVVRDGQTTWQPDSGQLLLDFSVAELATRAAPVARRLARDARRAEDDLSADRWFALGMDLEAAAPDDARDAYRRALELEPSHTEARLNLGRLLHMGGRISEAEAHYRAVLGGGGRSPTASFNLGTALEDQGRTGEAIAAYRDAIAGDPAFADAHFNLARLYERTGRRAAAIRHFRAYRDLTE